MSNNVTAHQSPTCKLFWTVVAAIVLSASLSACGEKFPDPVESKDGYAWIPIADTAFLIPEKTWLKSYGRKATDGSIDSFVMHVTAPDVQPWTEAVNEQMYPALGPGKMVRVVMKDIREQPIFNQYENFYTLPQYYAGAKLEEMESELATHELRRFGTTHWKDTAFYLRVENNRVRYFIRCDEDNDPPQRQFCHLRFPWSRAIYADFIFTRNYLSNSIQMAQKITTKLKEFEAAGLTRQHNLPKNQN